LRQAASSNQPKMQLDKEDRRANEMKNGIKPTKNSRRKKKKATPTGALSAKNINTTTKANKRKQQSTEK